MKHDDAYLEYLRQGFLRAGYTDLLPHDMDRGARDWERYYLGFAGSFNYFPISRTEFVAMTGNVQLPADSLDSRNAPECQFCDAKIAAGQSVCGACYAAGCRSSRHASQPAPQPSDPRSEGVARALKRLCDGADYRSGCADYEPER
jgi:hypothetical protein